MNPPWYRRVGPGLITVCVVIGPGSIMTSSTVGANHGYSMLWVILVSVAFMLVYMSLGAKLGAVLDETPCDQIRKRAGRWLAVLMGISVFFISAAFQSGNNVGVAAALEGYVESGPTVAALVVAFNALALLLLFASRNVYVMLERVMATFVAVMLLSFAVSLARLGPDPVAMVKGLVPRWEQFDLALLGLVGTTFVVGAAFYQAYLVQQKGWREAEVRNGLVDARIGSFLMAIITIMLMSTAAAGIYTGSPVALGSPLEVAASLERTFGAGGKLIFCIGLFSAAYSSYLINSMIGGFILADGLGLPCGVRDTPPRWLTAAVLLAGMLVALASMLLGFDRTPTIIAAQAVTVVVAPLVAGVLLWLSSSREVMGRHVSGPATRLFAGLGWLLLLAMAANTALVTLPGKIQEYRGRMSAAPTTTAPTTAEPAAVTVTPDE